MFISTAFHRHMSTLLIIFLILFLHLYKILIRIYFGHNFYPFGKILRLNIYLAHLLLLVIFAYSPYYILPSMSNGLFSSSSGLQQLVFVLYPEILRFLLATLVYIIIIIFHNSFWLVQ